MVTDKVSHNRKESSKVSVSRTFWDTDFFYDEKIQYILAEYGAAGVTWYLRIALAILSEGGELKPLIARTFLKQLGCDSPDAFFEALQAVELIYLSPEKNLRSLRADREIASLQDKRAAWSARQRNRRNRDSSNTPPYVTRDTPVNHRESEKEKEMEEEKEMEKVTEPVENPYPTSEDLQWTEEHLVPVTRDILETNAFMQFGRRPMRKYSNLWISPSELSEVSELYERTGLPKDFKHLGFRFVAAYADKEVSNGRNSDQLSAYNWLIGFGLTHALEQYAKSLNVKRLTKYTEGDNANANGRKR